MQARHILGETGPKALDDNCVHFQNHDGDKDNYDREHDDEEFLGVELTQTSM